MLSWPQGNFVTATVPMPDAPFRAVADFFVLTMEVIVWTAILVATAGVVWALAPYHQRIIDNRDIVAVPEDWD
jgi:hypothetical protein